MRAGEDPAENDRRKRLDEAAQKAASLAQARDGERLRFEVVVDEFIDLYAKPRNRRWKDTRRVMDFDATRVWRGRSLADISRRDVIELIDDVDARSP